MAVLNQETVKVLRVAGQGNEFVGQGACARRHACDYAALIAPTADARCETAQRAMAPHRGAGPAFNDVLAGHIQMMSASVGGGFPFTQAGKLRPLGVGSPKRLAVLADTPTFIESGFAGFVASLWFGLGAPPNMPKPLVDRLSAELKAALEKPEVVAKLRSLGTDPEYLSPAEFSARASSDFEQWGKVLRDNNIKPD